MEKIKLIPDTNFLIYLVRYRMLDKLDNFNVIILSNVIDELKKLKADKEQKREDKIAAEIVLEFIESSNFEKIVLDGFVDDVILDFAEKINAAVGTMDKELGKKAKERGIKVIKIRQRKYLE